MNWLSDSYVFGCAFHLFNFLGHQRTELQKENSHSSEYNLTPFLGIQ